MLKKFTKIILCMAAAVMAAVSCEKAEIVVPEGERQLEVNANNISGRWTLAELDGQPLLEGTYVHFEFVRNDKTYVITDGMKGFTEAPKTFEGRFDFEEDPRWGTVLIGQYDHQTGDFWKDKYAVVSLTADTMVLKGVKTGRVQTLVRMEDK